MKIYLFFERLKAERLQFKYDRYRVLVSLKFRPRNWRNHYGFDLSNETEHMHVWIANGFSGLSFTVDKRKYGKVTFVSVFFGWLTWRRKLLHVAREAAESPWVEKYGYNWNRKNGL